MVLKPYTTKRVGTLRPPFTNPYFHDTEDNIQSTGVLVDSDTYDGGTFLDRDYEVRGLQGFSILVENLDGANSLDYTIQETTKDYDDLDADLVDADFVNVTGHTDVAVAALSKGTEYVLIRLAPGITAVRLRARRTSAGLDATLRADVKGW